METMVNGRASGLRVVRGDDPASLATHLARELSGALDDPFAAPLILTPGPGVQRWLSQQLARASDPAGEGVCAGFDFRPLSRLEWLLSGRDDRDDPWSVSRLVWHILELADGAAAELRPLARHLAANEQRYANASRIAGLFQRYARHRPALLRSWSDGAGDELGFDAWQAYLWRALHGRIAEPDPVQSAAALRRRVADGSADVPWPAAVLFLPRRFTAADAELVRALAARIPVDAYVYEPRPDVGTLLPLVDRLGQRAAEVGRVLADASDEVLVLDAAPATAAVEVHSCHGLDRQVEVLRETLAGLFADDPTLEPRDVVIATPSVADLMPHVAAAFTLTDSAAGWQHPGYGFRVQVAAQSASDGNALLHLVREVTELAYRRATAGELLSFCGHPFVARRFGFDDDALDRLENLVPRASIRWGLNAAHRALFGLDGLRQNTWLTGVQRLMLGEALGDESQATASVITPVDDVESTDVTVLGAFAELVSRLTRFSTECRAGTTARGWVARFRAMAERLADVPFEESWQLGQLWSVLDRLDRRGAGSEAQLGSADALALLDAEFATRSARPAFGNGSLVVCGLADLAQVPHRVVCLVGLDDRGFPRRGIADGDDLLALDPQPGDPDPGADDRQALLDALGAARDRLVLLYQGRSSLTNEEYPPPSGVIDLIEATSAERCDEALQPFSPRYFEGPPRSFDLNALRAARALTGPRRGAPDRFDVGYLPAPSPSSVDLETLRSFVVHPGKYFLRQRAQLTLGEDVPPDENIPLELSGLLRWQIGDRVLAELLGGRPAADIERRERLRGELPPGELGTQTLRDLLDSAQRIADRAAELLAGTSAHQNVDLAIGGVRVTGRLLTHDGRLVRPQFSRVKAKHLAEAWVDLLALSVARGDGAQAVLIDSRGPAELAVPDPCFARAQLATLVDLAAEGLRTVLPMPALVCQFWARSRRQHRDPLAGYGLRDVWDEETRFDDVWGRFFPRGREPWKASVTAEPWAQRGEPTRLGSLAALVWEPIVEAQS